MSVPNISEEDKVQALMYCSYKTVGFFKDITEDAKFEAAIFCSSYLTQSLISKARPPVENSIKLADAFNLAFHKWLISLGIKKKVDDYLGFYWTRYRQYEEELQSMRETPNVLPGTLYSVLYLSPLKYDFEPSKNALGMFKLATSLHQAISFMDSIIKECTDEE
jgi:hypothetical protein